MALATRVGGQAPHALLLLGLFGAALLYGDGMITPAISVLSAMEGLAIATPALGHFVVPLTIAVLIGLFALQHRGTASHRRAVRARHDRVVRRPRRARGRLARPVAGDPGLRRPAARASASSRTTAPTGS